jgi:hypothetical protein
MIELYQWRSYARIILGVTVIGFASCGNIIESSFPLKNGCRAPKWIVIPKEVDEMPHSIKMNTYVKSNGAFSEFILYDSKDNRVDSVIARGLDSVALENSDSLSGYDYFEILELDGITDVLRYDYSERARVTFCMVDDPVIIGRVNELSSR